MFADLVRELERPVRMENDANCFALSEAIDGAGCGYETVFGVIMGTGVGGGIINQGELIRGRLNISGEWGHNLLETDGPRCYCGRRGCVETFLSGPGLAADYVRRGGSSDATAEDTIHLAAGGDEIAELSVQAFLQRFGRALATVINILGPACDYPGWRLVQYPTPVQRREGTSRPACFLGRVRHTDFKK